MLAFFGFPLHQPQKGKTQKRHSHMRHSQIGPFGFPFLHLLKSPGKITIFPVVKSIPFKTNRGEKTIFTKISSGDIPNSRRCSFSARATPQPSQNLVESWNPRETLGFVRETRRQRALQRCDAAPVRGHGAAAVARGAIAGANGSSAATRSSRDWMAATLLPDAPSVTR